MRRVVLHFLWLERVRATRPSHVWSIRTKLQIEGKKRDLALFNLAIDSKLRGCDVVAVRVDDKAGAVRTHGPNSACHRDQVQGDLWTEPDTVRSHAFMRAMDRINAENGRGTIHLASTGVERVWRLRSNQKSPRFTTDWSELLSVQDMHFNSQHQKYQADVN